MSELSIVYDPYKTPLRPVEKGVGFIGTIGRTKNGEYIQCHECGGLFKGLGVHAAKKHGLSEKAYREKYELAKSTPLVSDTARANYINSFSKLSIEEQERRIKSLHDGRAAAFRAQRITYVTKSLEQKNREGRCPDQLLDKIKTLADELERTPTQREFREHYGGFIKIIYATFGSWKTAVRQAGLDLPHTGRTAQYDRAGLIQMLNTFEHQHHRPPASADISRRLLPSQWVFTRVFGSWANALKAAGYEPLHSRNIPDPDMVLA